MKLSRRTRLTLELLGIAGLAVGMGVGFGKLRQPAVPKADIEPAETRSLSVAPPLPRAVSAAPSRALPPGPAAPPREPAAPPPEPVALPPEAKRTAHVDTLDRTESAPTTMNQPNPVAGRARVLRRAPRPRRAAARAESVAPALVNTEPAPAKTGVNAWDTDAYGGRR